jgi:hypothetical protein
MPTSTRPCWCSLKIMRFVGLRRATPARRPGGCRAATPGDFAGTNPSVARTSDGVQFGPYANGGTAGGSLYYNGFNGRKLSAIEALGFSARYNTTNDTTVGVPYLRIFLAGDAHDVIFSPNTQPLPQQTDENTANSYNVVAGTVRYDDDSGTQPDQAFATLQAAHADDVISGIYVSAGFSAGLDLSALLTDLTVNGTRFCFNCDPVPVAGTTGATGAAGAGGQGGVGPTGVTGAAGPAGAATPAVTGTAVTLTCSGDAVRVIRAPLRRGRSS